MVVSFTYCNLLYYSGACNRDGQEIRKNFQNNFPPVVNCYLAYSYDLPFFPRKVGLPGESWIFSQISANSAGENSQSRPILVPICSAFATRATVAG